MTTAIQADDPNPNVDLAKLVRILEEHNQLYQALKERVEELRPDHSGQWAGMGPDRVVHLGRRLDDVKLLVNPQDDPDLPTDYQYIYPLPRP